MAKTKYYRSNLMGSYTVKGVGDVPPAPSVLITSDKKQQEILDKHPVNGSAYGFSEVDEPKPLKTQNADGTIKKAKKEPEPAPPEEEAPEEKSEAASLEAEEVTNLQMARKYLVDNFDDLDARKLTNTASIRNAAEGKVEFPNWK